MVWRDRGKEEKQARLARKEARTRRKGKDHKKSLLAPNVPPEGDLFESSLEIIDSSLRNVMNLFEEVLILLLISYTVCSFQIRHK